jgi:hypothetical protein
MKIFDEIYVEQKMRQKKSVKNLRIYVKRKNPTIKCGGNLSEFKRILSLNFVKRLEFT